MFKNLLIPFDFSEPAETALGWALFLKQAWGAKLHLSIIDTQTLPDQTLLEGQDPNASLLERAQDHVQDTVEGLKLKKIPESDLEMDVLSEDSPKLLAEQSLKWQTDLLVTSTHGLHGFKHLLLGSHTEKLSQVSPIPLWVARGKPAWPPQRLLVPVDFSKSTEEALLMAAELHAETGSEIHLLHVMSLADLPNFGIAIGNYTGADLQRDLEKAAQEKLDTLKAQHAPLNLKTHLILGAPAYEICEFAREKKVDLILIPTHGHRGPTHWLMGNITEHVIRHAPCSVLSFCPKRGELAEVA